MRLTPSNRYAPPIVQSLHTDKVMDSQIYLPFVFHVRHRGGYATWASELSGQILHGRPNCPERRPPLNTVKGILTDAHFKGLLP